MAPFGSYMSKVSYSTTVCDHYGRVKGVKKIC